MTVYIKQNEIIRESTVMSENGMDNSVTKTAKLLPGNYKMSVSYDKKYTVIPVSPDSSKGVELSLKNDSLIYSYVK